MTLVTGTGGRIRKIRELDSGLDLIVDGEWEVYVPTIQAYDMVELGLLNKKRCSICRPGYKVYHICQDIPVRVLTKIEIRREKVKEYLARKIE